MEKATFPNLGPENRKSCGGEKLKNLTNIVTNALKQFILYTNWGEWFVRFRRHLRKRARENV